MGGRSYAEKSVLSPETAQQESIHGDAGQSPVHGHTQVNENLSLNVPAPDLTWPAHGPVSWSLRDEDFNGSFLPESASAFDFLPDFQEDGAMSELFRAASPPEASGSAAVAPVKLAEPLSIDQKAGHSATFIGYSNESDPFALNHFPHDKQDEVSFFRVTYRKVSTNENPPPEHPLHFLQSQEATAREARGAVDGCLPDLDDRSCLENVVDKTNGAALVRLYLRFVFPSLPIISRSMVLRDEAAFVKEAPTGLLAGIYALALPFAAWDESLCLHNAYASPSVEALWKITYTCLQRELQFPQLHTVQMFLLLLNYPSFDPVSVENPFAWSTAAAMLGMAQSLGLHADLHGCNLPAWEIRLRRRLWWAVVVEHSWRAVTHGRSSMLRDDDWDVSPLTVDDFSMDTPGEGLDVSPEYFLRLCTLTLIVEEICRKFLWACFSSQKMLD